MKSKHIEALISYRMERSRESIRAAEIMLENEMLTISMNRVYYSMFYAVQALFVLHKVSFSKHGQVKGYFNRELMIVIHRRERKERRDSIFKLLKDGIRRLVN